jgi:adenine-specific DNA-methyltransferase
MTKVFIGGSRRVSRLSAGVRKRIDNIAAKNFGVLIGDANGADKAVQSYLHEKHYSNVEVFCSAGACRNNIGNWQVRSVSTDTRVRNAQFYSAKDRVMTREADIGLMVWDGRSAGTLLNVMRLIGMNKKVVVYVVPDEQFRVFRHQDEWQSFFANCNVDLRREVEQRAIREIHSETDALQGTFSAF